jgi:hypothetical protein
MSVYNFLTWKNKDGGLYAYPASSKWIYSICFIKNTKQFELALINNDSGSKITSVHPTMEEAISVSQKHFNDNYSGETNSS